MLFRSCNSLHIDLHLTCSIVCCTLPCHASLTGHASYLIAHHAMFMLVCLPCCLLLPCLLLSLSSVSFRSCEDSFDYIRLSSSWTRSSSLRDIRQDDRYPGSHYYHCYASCFVLSLCRATYLLLIKPPKLP